MLSSSVGMVAPTEHFKPALRSVRLSGIRMEAVARTTDDDALAQAQPKRLSFDRYLVDFDRGCLLLDGNEVALRPKTFALLSYLIRNNGRLVSKDELFTAVWPNVAVT